MLVLFSDHTWYYATDEENAKEIQRNHIWRPKTHKRKTILVETCKGTKVLPEDEKGA